MVTSKQILAQRAAGTSALPAVDGVVRTRTKRAPFRWASIVALAGLLGSLLVTLPASYASAEPKLAEDAVPPVPNVSSAGWQSGALWIAEKVAGGLIAGGATKGFNEVLTLLTGDKTSQQLDEIKNKLDSIQNQLDQLQSTMNLILQEVGEIHYEVLAGPVKTLRNAVDQAEGDFLEDLSLAGKSDPQSQKRREFLTKRIEDAVSGNGGLISQLNTIPEAILPSTLTAKPFYRAVSDVVTTLNTKRFFTWRDSDRIDAVYQYLLDLQALQFNLVIQVETLEAAPTATMFSRYVEPYLGDEASFKAFLDKKTPTPTKGQLHNELGAQLTPLPRGVVLETTNHLEWSVDVPGGAEQKFLDAYGVGVPLCTTQAFPPGPSCVQDPHDTIGPNQPNWPRNPNSPAGQLASHMEALGYGAAAQWQVPLMSDLQSLQAGWKSSDGSLNNWLQTQMGADPTKCKPVTAGTNEAISDWNACVWPKYPFTWSSDYWGTKQEIKDDEGDVVRTYIYGFGFNMYNTDNGATVQCHIFTKKLDWSDLHYSYTTPRGPTMDLAPTGSCGGPLLLVRVLRPGEQFYFPA